MNMTVIFCLFVLDFLFHFANPMFGVGSRRQILTFTFLKELFIGVSENKLEGE